MSDARFRDGAAGPGGNDGGNDGGNNGGNDGADDGAGRALTLFAADPGDLSVISALVQDAVLPAGQIRWRREQRQLVMLLSRFRHERQGATGPERVRTLLIVDDVQAVASQGVPRDAPDLVLSILALDWRPAEDGAGRIEIVLAGDGALAAEVECINVTLRDVSRPYAAPSGLAPDHGL